MSIRAPTIREGSSPARNLTPSWARSLSRRQKSKEPESRPQSVGLLVPKPTCASSESGDSRSMRSNRSRGRNSFREMVNRFRSSSRSSSSLTLVDHSQLQESDFKQINGWFLGFDRYNQLVTTRISPGGSYSSEEFCNVANILSKNCGGRFIHGLPEAVFDLSLLWCPAVPLKRGDSSEPSWSWTAWSGAVNYPFDPTNCPDLPRSKSESEWFRSEILHYHIGPQSAPYTIRREKKDSDLRTHYPPYFHAPRGYDASADSNKLRFSAYTIPADGFTADQLHYEGKEIPCSQLMDEKERQCGVIMDFEESISAPSSTGPFEFVLVSRNLRREPAQQTQRPSVPTIHPPGTPIWDSTRFVWDQEVVDYDEDVFAPGPWKVLNVLLIKWVGDHAERVAVARIHEDAWLQRNPIKKDIVLR